MGGHWARWRWFELSWCQDVENLHTFSVEKKAWRKRRMFNMKYNIRSSFWHDFGADFARP
jgi:hypothetical protein